MVLVPGNTYVEQLHNYLLYPRSWRQLLETSVGVVRRRVHLRRQGVSPLSRSHPASSRFGV